MGNARVWIFRFLISAAGSFLVWTWFQPWWASKIREADFTILIRPWGLEHNLEVYAQYVPELKNAMPAFFAPLMWIYLGIVIAALLYSVFVKNKEFRVWKVKFTPSLIIGLVGLSFVVIVVLAYIVASIRTAEIGIEFIGTTYIEIDLFPIGANADSDLQLGYWLACAAGPLLVILALLRYMVIDRSKINS